MGVYNLNQHYSKSLMTIAIVMERGSGRGESERKKRHKFIFHLIIAFLFCARFEDKTVCIERNLHSTFEPLPAGVIPLRLDCPCP